MTTKRIEGLKYKHKGSGLPIVFLHSSLASKSQWDSVLSVLSAEFNTVAIDLLGYGENPCLDLDYADDFSMDVEVQGVMNTLNPLLAKNEAFHIIGHSYGGAVALKLAQQMPERILSLTLYEPVCFHLLPHEHPEIRNIKRFYSMCKQLIVSNRPMLAAEMFIDYWNGKGAFHQMSDKHQQAFGQRIHKVLLDFVAILTDPMTVDDLRSLPFVTHLMAGKKSRKSSLAIIELLKDNLVYSTLDTIDAGHLAPITHAPLFNQRLYRYYMPEQSLLAN